jgi:hypothetical protein
LKIYFNDGTSQVIDFSKFLNMHEHPQFNKYKNEKNFKSFKIENGNVVWGKDWDLIFPVYQLYKGKIQTK